MPATIKGIKDTESPRMNGTQTLPDMYMSEIDISGRFQISTGGNEWMVVLVQEIRRKKR